MRSIHAGISLTIVSFALSSSGASHCMAAGWGGCGNGGYGYSYYSPGSGYYRAGFPPPMVTQGAYSYSQRMYGQPMYSQAETYRAPSSYARPEAYQQPGVQERYAARPNLAPPPAADSRAASPATVVTVGLYDNYFQPRTLNVQPGTTVKWVNYGRHTHTVTANNASWDSGDIAPGESYSATFRQPGTYNYHCHHHTQQRMEGTIVVGRGGEGNGRSASAGTYR
jgi:plastocyanin